MAHYIGGEIGEKIRYFSILNSRKSKNRSNHFIHYGTLILEHILVAFHFENTQDQFL